MAQQSFDAAQVAALDAVIAERLRSAAEATAAADRAHREADRLREQQAPQPVPQQAGGRS
ncbi:hypothetical protein [Streptomyces sp. CBMA156]|uniref:hypothetical protein n=1 Tax=Streptomyces sp. CBMA156 TaxID=1930280 RepID=UPI001661CE2C|nr:hypothetical protein [Streptomyces sp. CBMA156]MBD0671622.1 hypothetical protein [Streptomyces sp. CBMA156]MBD0671632.1 hypothetical protein [Streptomyces sp. CBMA156]